MCNQFCVLNLSTSLKSTSLYIDTDHPPPILINSLPASSEYYRLVITFANRLDPGLDPNRLKKFILKKVSRQQQKYENLPSVQRVNELIFARNYIFAL